MADNFEEITNAKKTNCKNQFKKYSSMVDFNHIYIVFRDRITNGTDIDKNWQ